MSGWDILVYVSAGVVYFAVIATIGGWIKYEKQRKGTGE
jgi:hypothetical protein